MPNVNQNFSEAGNVVFDNPVKGQPALALSDPYKQIALRPSLRRGAILPYSDSGFEGIFAQLTQMLGPNGYRTVNARKFYWAQYDQLESVAFGVVKSSGGVPAGGSSVTVKVNRLSMVQNGAFIKTVAGYNAVIKENNRQIVKITAVIPVSAGDFNITFEPINGEVLNLTLLPQYTIVLMPMRVYDIDSTHDIKGEGVSPTPPILWNSQVQKFEKRIDLNEDEIDGYIYNKEWTVSKGLDANGNEVDQVYSPFVMKYLQERMFINRTLTTLVNQYDATTDSGFDGVIPRVQQNGLFNMSYDALLNGSFVALLMNMIKSIRRINGSNEYMLLHSFNFGVDWSIAMAELVRQYGQNLNYSLFGAGGEGDRDFSMYQFKDWAYSNYKFKAMQIDAFDSPRFGQLLPYFALLIPAKRFRDSEGQSVPWLTYTNVVGAEPAKAWKSWAWDFRNQGGRNLSLFAKDAFGVEIHSLQTAGIIQKSINS